MKIIVKKHCHVYEKLCTENSERESIEIWRGDIILSLYDLPGKNKLK